ncbi:toxin-antitoxin system HicB family antitoxin [uncultured Oscillibacter sp.]|uniref:toxin-antitoxin system HicB family antitoxin n=1 Tax=uncultured Oscillibacter sp. TaxID=876091 RepID=UPI0025D48C9A|nr:toxin-antitoxin system HicB family antitoxin [uncultured Oscillibacter sp.]
MNKDLNYYMGLSYKIEIVEDKKEGGYAFSCPELKGCVTYAENLEAGYDMLQDAKRSWFEACLEDNAEIPEPSNIEDFSGQFKLRIPKSLHKALADKSREEGISMNQYCLYLLAHGTR